MRKLLLELCLQPPLTSLLQGFTANLVLRFCTSPSIALRVATDQELCWNTAQRLPFCFKPVEKVKKKFKLTHTPDEAKEELVTSPYLQISSTRSQISYTGHPNSSMFLPYWSTHNGFLLSDCKGCKLFYKQDFIHFNQQKGAFSLFSSYRHVLLVCTWSKLAFALSTSLFPESRKPLRCHWRLPRADLRGGFHQGPPVLLMEHWSTGGLWDGGSFSARTRTKSWGGCTVY